MEAARLFSIMRRWWWLFALGIAVGGIASFLISQSLTPVYRAEATLLVNQTQTPGVIAYNDVLTSERLTKTYRELLTQRPLLDEVIDRVGQPATASQLSNMMSVSVIRDTQLLRLAVESADPTLATILANTAAEVFIDQSSTGDLTGPGSVSIVEPAVQPTSPVKPNTNFNIVLGIIAALMLVGITVVLAEYLDDTVKSEQEVNQVAGTSTLGVVMRFAGSKRQQLVTAFGARSAAGEAFRSIRTNVQFATVDRPNQVLLVTSPNAGDGKSTTAANLAVTMAAAGKRVVLVDADLRKPSLHNVFNLQNKVGLTSALLSGNGTGPYVQEAGFENLRFVASGPLPPNPSELLASTRMRTVIDALRSDSDVVILDSPPALVVTDAAILAAIADGTILVTVAGKTRSAALRHAVDALTRAKDNLLGAVLNKAGQRGAHTYYYHHYYYGEDRPAGRKTAAAGKAEAGAATNGSGRERVPIEENVA